MLEAKSYLIKEQVGLFKLLDVYDIFDPETQQQIGVAREEPGGLIKSLRLVLSKKLMPTWVNVRKHPSNELVFSLHKPFSLFRAHVNVHDGAGKRIGYFKSKVLSIGGGFWVYDDQDKLFAEIKGKWHGWDFKFVTPDAVELGSVTKKWAGLGKELFTSADNYVVTVSDSLAGQPVAKMLLLGAALAIDVVFKEAE